MPDAELATTNNAQHILNSQTTHAYLSEGLHHVRASPGVRHVGDLGLLLQDQLRVARNTGTELRGQTKSLVEGVRVQRLTGQTDR